MQTLGTVIAIRILTIEHDDKDCEILVEIGCPVPFPDGRDYYCPYRITGLGDGKIRGAGGIDAVQALFLTMQMIGVDLAASPEARTGGLRWVGFGPGEFGFPEAPATIDRQGGGMRG